jgi:hypothetical protein
MPMDYGTIGSRPCELVLNKILIEHDDPKLVKKTTKLLFQFRHGLEQLSAIPELSFRLNMLQKWRADFMKRASSLNMPREVETHVCCCLVAYYRECKQKQNKLPNV